MTPGRRVAYGRRAAGTDAASVMRNLSRRTLAAGPLLLVFAFAPGVAHATPRAAFTVSPTAPAAGQRVNLISQSTDDTSAIDAQDWYVDGEYVASGTTMSYMFESAGSHDVELDVEDEDGDDDSTSRSIRVAEAPSETASGGQVEARLYYSSPEDNFQPVRLRIFRAGRQVFSRHFRPRCKGECPVYPRGGYGHGRSVRVRDLTGDGEPEIVFDLGWGNICCRETTVLTYSAATGRYVAHAHNWGDSSPGALVDPHRDGRPVWRSWDGRIRYVFGCGGCVAYPVQVVRYRRGRFVDVTRSYPRFVRPQARQMWRRYRRHPHANARATLAVWAADQYRLGQRAQVRHVLRHALRAGHLRRHGAFDLWPHDKGFVRKLGRWLHRNGYDRR